MTLKELKTLTASLSYKLVVCPEDQDDNSAYMTIYINYRDRQYSCRKLDRNLYEMSTFIFIPDAFLEAEVWAVDAKDSTLEIYIRCDITEKLLKYIEGHANA